MPITARQISFRYPRTEFVLNGISCAIAPKAITAIVGPNGGGKSTLIRLLAGLRTPEIGQVSLDEQDLKSITHKDRAGKIAFIEQRPNLAFDFAARRVVEFGSHSLAGKVKNDGARVEDVLALFDLLSIASKPYGHLSVGQQQRVSIARAWIQIASNPDGYLLADEPCSAMDPKHTEQTMRALKQLADTGVGVGVVIHDLTTAIRWANEAIVLDQSGRLVTQGPAEEVLTQEVLSRVFEVNIQRHEIENGLSVLIPSIETTE